MSPLEYSFLRGIFLGCLCPQIIQDDCPLAKALDGNVIRNEIHLDAILDMLWCTVHMLSLINYTTKTTQGPSTISAP